MSQTRYLETADAIGARLCRDAIWAGNRCNWLGDSMEYVESRWQVVHRSFGPEMYSGTSGIALFLARLFVLTQDRIIKKTAEGAIQNAIAQLDGMGPENFGFYSGRTGIAFVFAEIAELLANDELLRKSLEILRTVPKDGIAAQTWDVISGSAGVIPVLLRLQARFGEDFLSDAALRHGDLLLEGANRSDEGWSWKTIPTPGQNLTGFSHGTAGIAWALLELHSRFKEQRFLDAAQEALRYERRWFDREQENWPDFRSPAGNGSPQCAMAWCHGAPGIGLSRVRVYQMLKDQESRAEAEAATRSTTRALHSALQTGQGNYSLCHGNLGNAELLISAGDVLKDGNKRQMVLQMADDAGQKYRASGTRWPCGVLNGGETPSLMLGLAGIGYFYLRLHDPARVPSILLVGPQ
jgi:type 2 lantibiotic biosynthesis protein LanM